MQAAETELKFPVTDVAAFRALAERVGLHLQTERTFESNTLYDTPERSLRAKTQVLRLRNYGDRCVLTHKRLPDGSTGDSRYKTRIETETLVEDCSAMEEVFRSLGLLPVFRYEKYRTEWDDPDGGHLVLDETPIGVWAELEGQTEWIDEMLERLGVAPDDCSTGSYGSLFLLWKNATGSAAENLTFGEAVDSPGHEWMQKEEPAEVAGL